MECPFCRIDERDPKQVIRSTAHTLTIFSEPRLMKGHILIIPRRHVEHLAELTTEERSECFGEILSIDKLIREKIAPGCDISQRYRPDHPNKNVRHLHIHMRPRSFDDELYLRVQKYEEDIALPVSEDEREEIRTLLKD